MKALPPEHRPLSFGLPPEIVPDAILRKRHWQVLVLGIVVAAISNMLSPRLFDAAVRRENSNFIFTPMSACTLGVIGAEIFVLAAYAAFGPNRWHHRLFLVWFVALVWCAAWSEGALAVMNMHISEEEFRRARHSVGEATLLAGWMTAVATATLLLIRRARRVTFIHVICQNADRPTAARAWSIRDLFLLTSLAGVSLALLRYAPPQAEFFEPLIIVVAAVLSPAVAIVIFVSCFLIMPFGPREKHSNRLPGCLVVACGLLILIGLTVAGSQTDQAAFAGSVLAVPISYAAAVMAAFIAGHYAGWRLAWDQPAADE